MQDIFKKLSILFTNIECYNNIEEERTFAITAIIHYIDALFGRSLNENTKKQLQKLLYDLSRELEIRYGL